jgi:hypothetical protein
MSPGRRIIPPLIALWVAACTEAPSTAVALAGGEESLDLDLLVPRVAPDLLVSHEQVELGASHGSALVLDNDPPPDEQGASESQIWNAYTDLAFAPGMVEAWGEHDYTGNKSRVEVSLDVRYEGVVIGSRTGSKEQTHVFLNPFAHHIIGNVIINTERECGLSADAHTAHAAWWEFSPGSGPNTIARREEGTFSGLERQPSCAPEPPTPGPGGGTIDEGSLDYTCWMLITYDAETLEILDIQAVWCTGGG